MGVKKCANCEAMKAKMLLQQQEYEETLSQLMGRLTTVEQELTMMKGSEAKKEDSPPLKRARPGSQTPGALRTVKHRQNLNHNQRELRLVSDRLSKKAAKSISIGNNAFLGNQSMQDPKAVEMNETVPSIVGNYSQSDLRFDYAPSCFGMALTSVCYPKNPSGWNQSDIHKILNLGYWNYEFMRKESRRPRNSFLGVDDAKPLHQMMPIEKFVTRFNIIEPCITGSVKYEQDQDDFFCNLETAVQRIFEQQDRALLLAEGKWFGIAKTGSKFALFNSHPVDVSNQPRGDGKAAVFFCENTKQLLQVIIRGLAGGDATEFQIFGVKTSIYDA